MYWTIPMVKRLFFKARINISHLVCVPTRIISDVGARKDQAMGWILEKKLGRSGVRSLHFR